ncbi:hypothetical protein JB92DRAFT_2811297 [Gautieria morchelliformis]|nr:hypothetical protein JB92DRAFT_2811297 [Gautieria morchelliformis]
MSFLEKLGPAASIISVIQLTAFALRVCAKYGAGVKNASKDGDRISTELLGLHSVLTQALKLANEETEETSRLSSLKEQLLVCDVEMRGLLTTLGADKEVLGKNLGRRGFMPALKWPLKEAEVNKTVKSIKNLKDSLTTAMEVDKTRLTLKIDGGVEALQIQNAEINQSIEKTKSGMGDVASATQELKDNVQSMQRQKAQMREAMEQARLQEHRQKIYDWLGAPDHQSKHRDACRARQKGTGSWFVNGAHFQDWRGAPHSFLWLHGIPGAGKTILCSTIIDELSDHCSSDPTLAMAFFYFDFNNKDSLPNAMLRSLIEQLSLQCASTPHALELLYSKNEQGDGQRIPGQHLMSTLKTIVKSFRAVYIVFDALDECRERSGLLKVLEDVHDWELDTLHLLATSREEGDIRKALSGVVSHKVPMDESFVGRDIRAYVSTRLKAAEFSLCSAAERQTVKRTLTQGAHGMFRWVVCQLDTLQKCRTHAALERALTRLPKTLFETYDGILAGIDEDDRRDALSLLQWLAFSVGTLSTDQAVEVLATDPDTREGPLFDRRRRLGDPASILTICSSLVTITPQEGSNAEHSNYVDSNNEGTIDHHDNRVLSTKPGEIRLAHFSVQEYLISEHLRSSTTALSYYWFNEKMAHVSIAKTCLAYMLQFSQDNGVNSDTARSYPLSRYAAVHWMDHAGWDAAGSSADLHELIMMLLEPTSAVYTNWMWIYHENDQMVEPGTVPLYIAAATGLERACQDLLDRGSDINAPGGYYGTPLQVAASQGHNTTVQWLLEKGADVNAQGGCYGSALNVAASQGHYTTVLLLLEKGAAMNSYGVNTLDAALSGENQMIFNLLLKVDSGTTETQLDGPLDFSEWESQ